MKQPLCIAIAVLVLSSGSVRAQGKVDAETRILIREMEAKKARGQAVARPRDIRVPLEFQVVEERIVGQAVIVIEEEITLAESKADVDDGFEPKPNVRQRRSLRISSGFFDQTVLHAQNKVVVRTRFNAQLESKIRQLEWTYKITLNKSQKDRLQLAGRGDMIRFFDRVENQRRIFESKRAEMDLDEFNKFQVSLSALGRTALKGPFEEGSLFSKMVNVIVEESKEIGVSPK